MILAFQETRGLCLLLIFFICFACTANAQWVMVDSCGMPESFASDGKYIYVGLRGGPDKPNILRSSDGGESWENVGRALPAQSDVMSLCASEHRIVAGAHYAGVFISSDYGDSWTQTAFDPSQYGRIYDLLLVDSLIYAGSGSSIEWHDPTIEQSGLFVSTDNGCSWARSDSGIRDTSDLYPSVYAFATIGSTIFAGTDHGVFSSNNGGRAWTWDSIGITTRSFAVIDSTLFAGNGRVWRSSDMGATWTAGPAIGALYLAASGNILIAGTSIEGVCLSTNMGDSWKPVNDGLDTNSLWIWSLSVMEGYMYAGAGKGLWRRALSEVTSVEESTPEAPKTFELKQNYPNPFNPSTKLSYQLAAVSSVSLKVFDLLGREVANLVDGVRKPGYYSITFDGSHLSSGIYFARFFVKSLSGGGLLMQTKKMLLLQ